MYHPIGLKPETAPPAPHLHAEPLAAGRLAGAKTAYTVRRVPLGEARLLIGGIAPRAGDVVLARVERLGQHQHLESAAGRRAKLWPGDEIVVAFGNRYAPDQFEAYVPGGLEPCHLVAGGGVAARVATRHGAIRAATDIVPLGLLARADGRPLNVMDGRLAALPVPHGAVAPFTIAVLGASMNAGKTTTCVALTRGLSACGLRVGAAKITGTGSGGDRWAQVDAGARPMIDFTEAGHATTFGLSPRELEEVMVTLSAHLLAQGAQARVLEIADGLLQPDTAALATSATFAGLVDGVIFAADGAMGAVAGVEWLRARGLPVLAVSGLVTASPLATQEAAEATGLPVLGPDEIGAGGWLGRLLAGRAEPVAA
jgi:hypothetical protein